MIYCQFGTIIQLSAIFNHGNYEIYKIHMNRLGTRCKYHNDVEGDVVLDNNQPRKLILVQYSKGKYCSMNAHTFTIGINQRDFPYEVLSLQLRNIRYSQI